MLLAFPYALLGSVTLAGLVAVYLFRNRFRQREVSSLMLWREVARPRLGGVKRDTLSLPPLFYLELAVLAAAVLAAAAPHVLRPSLGSLTVVLDTSASMSARGPDGLSALERAVRSLRLELGRTRFARVRLIAAGAAGPELVGVLPAASAVARLAEVSCASPSDSLAVAMARAGQMGEAGDEVLVLTDRAPDAKLSLGLHVRWLALGRPEPNAGITYADRSWRGDGAEALLIELRGTGRSVPLVVRSLGGGDSLFSREVELDGQGAARVVLDLPQGTPDLEALLPEDALALDNRTVLLKQRPRTVAAAVRVEDENLRATVSRAVTSTGRGAIVGGDTKEAAPQIVFADSRSEAQDAPFWQVVFCKPEQARLVRGPYLTDHAQPLLEGVSLDGLVWSVGTNVMTGRGLVFAGSVPLLTLEASSRRTPVVRVMADSAQTPFFLSAAWPALVWNVLDACSAAQPGPVARNLRAGEQAVFSVSRGEAEVTFDTPAGKRTLKTRAGRVLWAPERAGLYRMRTPSVNASFAVNLHAAKETDLSSCTSGRWGEKVPVQSLARTHRSYAWVAGAAALLLAACHHWALSRSLSPARVARESGGSAS